RAAKQSIRLAREESRQHRKGERIEIVQPRNGLAVKRGPLPGLAVGLPLSHPGRGVAPAAARIHLGTPYPESRPPGPQPSPSVHPPETTSLPEGGRDTRSAG